MNDGAVASAAAQTPRANFVARDAVLDRITEALHIVMRSTARPGPKQFGNTLSSRIIVEFSDMVGRGDGLFLAKEDKIGPFEYWLRTQDRAASSRFTVAEITAADEALSWPTRYLADEPLLRDAIWLVAWCRATGREIETTLARRRAKADAMLERRKLGSVHAVQGVPIGVHYAVNGDARPDVIRIYEDDAADLSAKITAWANEAMALPLSEAEIARLRECKRARMQTGRRKMTIVPELTPTELEAALKARNRRIEAAARIRFKREVQAAGAVERIVKTRRQDVLPGRHFNVKPLYLALDRGCAVIAGALQEAGMRP